MGKLGLSGFATGMGATGGGTVIARMMRAEEIGTLPELAGIFKINEGTLEEVRSDMAERGFDRAEPLVVWKGRNAVVDGHTRLAAAKAAGIAEIPVAEKEFEDLNEAMRYAYCRQVDRRNLTDAEIYAASTGLEPKVLKDGSGRMAAKLAKTLKVSQSKIERARVVEARADDEVKEAVKAGEMSINRAYESVREKKEKALEEARESAGQRRSGAFGDEEGFEEEEPLEAEGGGRDRRETGESRASSEVFDRDDESFEEEEPLEAEGGGRSRGEAGESGASSEVFDKDGFDDAAEYESPRIGLDEVVIFILGKGEEGLAREVVEEFVPERERGEFWGLFPPGVMREDRG
jgi:ParB family chromosome partitioning protein